MIDEFRSTALVAAAKRLGVNPFELVRLSVVFGVPTEDLRFTTEQISELSTKSNIRSFWQDLALPSIANPAEAAVRGVCGLMLEAGFVGGSTTRLDNLSRGLTPLQAEAIDEAIVMLADHNVVSLLTSPAGPQVSVTPGAEATVRAIADGSSTPDDLASLWSE